MADDKYNILGPLYSEIGGEIAEIGGGNPDGAYLYAEAGEGWVSASMFKEEGKSVRYFRATWPLCDLIMKAWKAEDPDKRWAVMEYSVTGTSFDAKFKFPDEIDTTKTEVERRPIALKARYGDKPVIYPPEPPGMMEFKGKTD